MKNPQEKYSSEDAAEWDLWRSGALAHLPYLIQKEFILDRVDTSDAELIQEHIEECTLCAAEVADLRDFILADIAAQAQAIHPVPIPFEPSPMVPETTQGKESIPAPGFWRRLFPPTPAHRSWAFAAASFGLLLGGGLCWTLAVSPLQQSVAQLQTDLNTLKVSIKPSPTPEETQIKKALAESSGAVAKANQKYTNLLQQMEEQTGRLNRLSQDYELLKKRDAARIAVASPPSAPNAAPPPRRDKLPAVLRLPDLSPLALALNSGGRGTEEVNPAARSFAILSPMGTKTPAARPTLRWQPLPGAAFYRVTIRSVDGEIFLKSDSPLKQSYWTPPNLVRDLVFEWQVVARDASGAKIGETPIARFAVLSNTEMKTYRASVERYGESGLGSVLAAAEAGLWELAEQKLDYLLLNDGNSALRAQAEAWREQISAKRSRLFSGDAPLPRQE